MDGFSERLTFAIDAARQAGAATMSWFQSADLVADGKSDGSPVTQADRAAERLIRDLVARKYPQDGVLGEEYPPTEGTSGRTWIVDPIDGTMSFVRGVPLFGTMLACMNRGEPEIGVIAMPALDEWVAAEVGAGCWWYRQGRGPDRARVSDHDDLKGAMLLTTSMEYYRDEAQKHAWARFVGKGAHNRGWSDCYAFVLLATGRADAVVEPGVKLWDVAAIPPIINEAGGVWTDIDGTHDLEAGSIIASNGHIHGAVVEVMRSGGR